MDPPVNFYSYPQTVRQIRFANSGMFSRSQEEKLMKKSIFSAFVLTLVFTAATGAGFAQRETDNGVEVEKNLDLLRRDLRAEKKKILAMNVPLTETEATKFWPVYDRYAAEMSKHYDDFYAVIKDYAAKQKTLTDADAISMVKRWSDIQF